ncbi:uncharacterized protein LOC141724920 [Apium graveolens]|uniref:uncharacterized protein LOC141724920 n=1 Tax=Apium graveolens TaxID=4045 RepID=UPI003D7B804F
MNPTWPLQDFLKKVVNDWGCHVSIYAIARAKRKALQKINGKHVEQYSRVWDYDNALLKAFPDSTVLVMTEDVVVQKRLDRKDSKDSTFALEQLRRDSKRGLYGGQLLAAIGTDANNGMYPLAWAVVEAENSESWNWFLKQVVEDLNIENDNSWTFISDRQNDLINALENIVPNAEHRFCVMHLYRNMWKEHKGIGVRMILWKAARATTEYTFKKHMDELQKLSKKCYDWLSEKPRTQWNRSAFRLTPKSDQRDKMLNSYALNPICPNAMRRLNKSVELIKGCHAVWSGGAKYLVTMSDGGYQMVVDLEAKRCACRKWEISAWSKKNYEEYIHACYSKDNFLATYNHILDPICGEEEWDATDYPKPLPHVLKAHDKANGCEKQVKTRTKKAKTAKVGGGKEASNSSTLEEASQGGQETPNQGGQSGERRPRNSCGNFNSIPTGLRNELMPG